jgi:LPS-assembly protein
MKARSTGLIIGILFIVALPSYAAEKKSEPLTVNGDTVEYSTDNREVSATGNVEVIYRGAKLTCHKMTVNTLTKEAVAEGDARLEDPKGIIEGKKIAYNFQTKKGTILEAKFRADPYFGTAKKVEKVSDFEFVALRGYATTCELDKPHYRIGSQQIKMFPGDKMQTKGDTFYLWDFPLLYLSHYNQSLKKPLMHVSVMPGSRKDWGPYLLSTWRYNLAENLNGNVYLDYRSSLGFAEGFGLNYDTKDFGKGDYKFYYTDEKPDNLPQGTSPSEFNRYLMRLRHKWTIDERTNFISELYKIKDDRRKFQDPARNILKDYFYREYEKDSQPLSYALLHHNFSRSSLDILAQKRVNHWFDQLDKLPELKYTLPSLQIGESWFYFENNSSAANYNKKATTSPVTTDDVSVARFDTTNKFSLPMRVAFVQLTPFVGNRETIYDKGVDGKGLPIRTIFLTGADLSTKFYRILNVRTGFLGLDINGLRHIITPTVGYAYNHAPTISSSNIKQIDTVDSLTASNSVALGLSNKLQTKRNGQSVDLLDCLVTTSYILRPNTTGDKHGGNLTDFLIKLKLLPYSWLRLESDATYNRSVSRSDPGYNRFSTVNYDANFSLGRDMGIGIGQRYERSGSNQITYSYTWRINPKWKFASYMRYNIRKFRDTSNVETSKGVLEQQYTVTRDLHCWEMDVSFNSKKNQGATIYFVFRLKAFPENEFGFDQSYHKSSSGSQ